MSKLRAGRTFDYQLEADRGEGEVFQLRVLSGEQSDLLAEICSQFRSETEKDKRTALFAEALQLAVVAWPWDGTLRSVLTDRECWELVAGAQLGAALTPEERKKFVSPSRSETETSVTGAASNAGAS